MLKSSGWAARVLKFACLATLMTTQSVWAQPADETISIEALLSAGWQIAGFTGAVDNWATFTLFRHPNETYLVQCRAGYDATRDPHVKPHCYKLR
jgi:hypothetical protein